MELHTKMNHFSQERWLRCHYHFGLWLVGNIIFPPVEINQRNTIDNVTESRQQQNNGREEMYSFNGICFCCFFLFDLLCVWYPGSPQCSWGQHGPIWGRQDQSGPHVGPMNFAIWDDMVHNYTWYFCTYGVMLCTYFCGHYLTIVVNV